METLTFTKKPDPTYAIPAACFSVYRYVLAFNHFRNEVHILENIVGEEDTDDSYQEFVRAAFDSNVHLHPFSIEGAENSVLSDEEFLSLVRLCKGHIARGDVFQIVPSRRYLQAFKGDDLQVYRALRSINPSPYLFYGDFGGYNLFGSSPEAQIVVQERTAGIYPIAGTTPRSGDASEDRVRVERLLADPKENAEHCMLVDLARNDLSRHCKNVHVSKFREVHHFSHVIHLVSKVEGTLAQDVSALEPIRRGHYGGAIGFLGFNGDAVLGIMIRSFLSINNTLVYQAGGGVVYDSDPENEMREVHAKLGALRAAIKRAEEI